MNDVLTFLKLKFNKNPEEILAEHFVHFDDLEIKTYPINLIKYLNVGKIGYNYNVGSWINGIFHFKSKIIPGINDRYCVYSDNIYFVIKIAEFIDIHTYICKLEYIYH
jgi:hypothetical protein